MIILLSPADLTRRRVPPRCGHRCGSGCPRGGCRCRSRRPGTLPRPATPSPAAPHPPSARCPGPAGAARSTGRTIWTPKSGWFWAEVRHRSFKPALRIQDVLVWIRIRVSMPRTNGSRSRFGPGSFYFRHWPSRDQQKTNLRKKFFCSLPYFLKVHLHHFSNIKSEKAVTKQ